MVATVIVMRHPSLTSNYVDVNKVVPSIVQKLLIVTVVYKVKFVFRD